MVTFGATCLYWSTSVLSEPPCVSGSVPPMPCQNVIVTGWAATLATAVAAGAATGATAVAAAGATVAIAFETAVAAGGGGVGALGALGAQAARVRPRTAIRLLVSRMERYLLLDSAARDAVEEVPL